MPLDLPLWTELADQPRAWPVEQTEHLFDGRVLSLIRDTVRTPDGDLLDREIVQHPGAVAILALDIDPSDAGDRGDAGDPSVVLLRQYRHPVRQELVEIPAGLLDVAGEDAWAAARRELAEEAQLEAASWHVLADLATSPGGNREILRIFLARGLTPAARPDGFVVEGEEAHMSVGRAPLSAVRDAVLAGAVAHLGLTVGVLAWYAAGQDPTRLRPADAPWPLREALHDPAGEALHDPARAALHR